MDSETPFLLLFTSGTTGSPKGVVHTHIGFTAKLVIDLWLLLDCKPEDRILWMSDMGWVIGPLLVFGSTLVGSTLLLVEGAPNHPGPDRMWRIARAREIIYLGVAPTTVRTFMAQGSRPRHTHDLSRLRMLISAGEAWTTAAWLWHHGDSASRDADGQWYIHGRSDDTMKIAGKRTGPAEIESLLMATGKLHEAAAVAVPDPIKGASILVACSPLPGIPVSGELRVELEEAVVHGMGTPFRPHRIIFLSDLPKTRNMKIIRRVIRAVCTGEDPGDLSSQVNPEAVEELREMVEVDGATSPFI